MDPADTARFISRFAAILADEADRSDLDSLARILRVAEAEATKHFPQYWPSDDDIAEFVAKRLQ